MTGNLAHNPTNDTRYADLEKQIKAFGTARAKGADSMPMFGMALLEGAANGVISSEKDADGRDAVSRLYDKYAENVSKKVYADRSSASTKAQISKLRAFVNLGENTKVDGVIVMSDFVKLHRELAAADENVKPAYNAMVALAVAQNRADAKLTDEEMRVCALTKEPKAKTVEGLMATIERQLEKLISNEGPIPFDCDDDMKSKIIDLHDDVRDICATFTIAAEKVEAVKALADAQAKLVELGIAA